jgi:hypothetical protein
MKASFLSLSSRAKRRTPCKPALPAASRGVSTTALRFAFLALSRSPVPSPSRYRLFSLRHSPNPRVPDPLEVHEIALHFDSWNRPQQTRRCPPQLGLVMRGFGLSIATERAGQSSIGAAIGVHHKYYAPGSVQPHGLANLIQHELTIALMLRRGQTLRSSRHLDRIGIDHADAFEKLCGIPAQSGCRSTRVSLRRSGIFPVERRNEKPSSCTYRRTRWFLPQSDRVGSCAGPLRCYSARDRAKITRTHLPGFFPSYLQ